MPAKNTITMPTSMLPKLARKINAIHVNEELTLLYLLAKFIKTKCL